MSWGDQFGETFGQLPAGWEVAEAAIRAWVVATSGLDGVKVIFAEQNGPRPAVPFATVRLGAVTAVGVVDAVENLYDVEGAAGQEIVQIVHGQRLLEVEVRAFSARAVGASNAREILALAQASLRFDQVRELLAEAGLTVLDNGRITVLPVVLDAQWEGRAVLAVTFCFEERVSLATGYIAAVELTDAITEPSTTTTVEIE